MVRVLFYTLDRLDVSMFVVVWPVVFALRCWMVLLMIMLVSSSGSLCRDGARFCAVDVVGGLVVSACCSLSSLICKSLCRRWIVVLEFISEVLFVSGVDYIFCCLCRIPSRLLRLLWSFLFVCRLARLFMSGVVSVCSRNYLLYCVFCLLLAAYPL